MLDAMGDTEGNSRSTVRNPSSTLEKKKQNGNVRRTKPGCPSAPLSRGVTTDDRMKKAVLGTVVSLQGPIHCVGGGMAESAAGAAMVDVRQVWWRRPTSLQGELELAGEGKEACRALAG